MNTTTIDPGLFRMRRTFKAFNKTNMYLDKLVGLGNKDRHAAIQLALNTLAVKVLKELGQPEQARTFEQRLGELVPVAIEAAKPAVATASPTATVSEQKEQTPETAEKPKAKKYRGRVPKEIQIWMRKRNRRGRPPKQVSEWLKEHGGVEVLRA